LHENESDYCDEAEQIVNALGKAGLDLISPAHLDAIDAVEQLARRQSLVVREGAATP
jgi:hypothetical protein